MSKLLSPHAVIAICILTTGNLSCRPTMMMASDKDGQAPSDGALGDAQETCVPGAQESCYDGPAGTEGVSACQGGTRTCQPEGYWGTCVGQVVPENEVCDEQDNDCNNQIDEGLTCVGPGAECGSNAECLGGLACLLFPDGVHRCAALVPCTPPDPCEDGSPCVEFPDDDPYTEDYYCLPTPEMSCWAHYWFDLTDGSEGHHVDTCMNCNNHPGLEEGSQCTWSQAGSDLDLRCEPMVIHPTSRKWSSRSIHWFDFLAIDHPFVNPQNVTSCFIGWGVHPLVLLEDSTVINGNWRATIKLVGGGADSQPLQMGQFTTILPAAAFQQTFVEAPPLCSAMPPQTKAERAARVFWEESSVTGIQNQNMPYSYAGCPTCVTWGDLVTHMYPGPEIYCQGLSRDPADSNFVVPFWMPHYDTYWGTDNLAIVSELICHFVTGDIVRSVTANAFPYDYPDFLPQSYPYP